MHYHFDPIGGVAGDMFVGALLDLRPDAAAGAIAAVRATAIDAGVTLAQSAFSDGILSGSRFEVGLPHVESHHHHVHWSTLRAQLSGSALASAVRERAIAIFAILAEAEARVHDKPVENVTFHEVGAWDSVADIVAAAYLIEELEPCTWSIGLIPLGSGRVRTEHGLLPLPAPATALLLDGFRCFDDGFAGERVTPTGAAIIRHLEPAFGIGATPRTMSGCGYGFGTRRFDGMSNVLRILEFESISSDRAARDAVSVIEFDVDDQSAEDLALGLERLRATDGVIDVVQMPFVGKQGRLGASIRVLAEAERVQFACEACFRETTTIGLRLRFDERVILQRRERTASGDIHVKIVERPGGTTAKAELGDVRDADSHAERESRRRAAEAEVIHTTKREQ